ncbi:MAG TPA: hypothetical protein VFK06_24680 [Candidatus Angelobacter sp.]|nr:hypothetical protein [Candidatus Angelobacter sp.]
MKKLALVVILLLASAAPGFAQLTVIDPASIQKQIQQLIAQNKQLVQLQQTYSLYQQIYSLQQQEAQSLQGLQSRYRYTFSNWQQFAAGNQYGNTGTFATGINSGQPSAVQAGYRQIVPVVQPVDITATPQAQQAWRQQYALTQLQDASIMNAMQAAGSTRTNLQQNAQTLMTLEADATNSALQSDKQIAQKTLVAILFMIRNLQDTNRMLEASINMQIQQLAQQRADRGQELNQAASDRKALGAK